MTNIPVSVLSKVPWSKVSQSDSVHNTKLLYSPKHISSIQTIHPVKPLAWGGFCTTLRVLWQREYWLVWVKRLPATSLTFFTVMTVDFQVLAMFPGIVHFPTINKASTFWVNKEWQVRLQLYILKNICTNSEHSVLEAWKKRILLIFPTPVFLKSRMNNPSL